ncbi:MAG: Holliday junction resolvase RuvX [Clostridia bacterium]|nr:Holliday junction resolvase RuvX [Clostridia bacterium]
MKILAVDLGMSRTGVALCDQNEVLAYPIGVIFQKDPDKLLVELSDAITQHAPGLVVFGLPKNMDNSEGDSANYVRDFAEKLSPSINCDITFHDERMSTVTAHNYLNQTNTRGKKRKNIVDAVAAVVILQSYLDYRKNNPS